MTTSARILLHSINPAGVSIITWELVIPKMFLAEFNTHCVIGRNSASSRAIPSERVIAAISENPYLPPYWSKNQAGMQASEELTPDKIEEARNIILEMRDFNRTGVQRLHTLGMHKQDANRYLEPWMYTTIIATMTDHANFFKLRANGMAQPAFAQLAYAMERAYLSSVPQQLAVNEWHLPLVEGDEQGAPIEDQLAISVARCARVSYVRQHDKKPIAEDIVFHNRLRDSGHWSPFEHQAIALATRERIAKFRGWRQYRKTFPKEVEGEEV